MLQPHSKDEKVSQYIGADMESFQKALYAYLRDEVVKIIKTDGTWSVGSILNQDVAKEMLNNILWWLFNGDPEKSLLELEQLNNPQHICGHVFKSGEPTYSCRDCAMDPTCVFCQQCFRNSEHKKHRYKMHTSSGGGCCDCGDQEAWTKYPACTVHGDHDNEMDADQDSVSRLPDLVRQRAPHFFEVLLRYAVDHLTNEWTVNTELVEELRPSVVEDCYVTMVFNDESRTFDYVTDILKKALKCDDAMGADFARVIDREGRSPVCIDDKKTCQEVKRIVSTPPAPLYYRTTEQLKALVIHVNIVAHQEMALLILPWLSRIVQQSEGLRAIFCEIAMKEMIQVIPQESISGTGFSSVIERFLRCDNELWKTAQNLYHQLTMNSLLLDAEMKKKLGILFTRLYNIIQEGFLHGDHEHGQSVASLSVQLFAVPTIGRHLIVHEDVICIVLRFIVNCVCNEGDLDSNDWTQPLRLNSRKMKKNSRRMKYCFYDLKYTLTNLPDQWTKELREKFVQGVQMLLQIFMAMQGMDAVTHKSGRHIEYEPDWETGVTLVMRFNPIIHHILQWCRTDQDLLFVVLKNCLIALSKIIGADPKAMKSGTTVYGEQTFSCIDYDITKQPVSTQFPVTRLTAAVLVELGRFGITWNDILENIHLASEFSMADTNLNQLLECSLRCLCLSVQVNAGIWRRNGLSLVNQIFYYKDSRCRKEAFERDVQMLQACASKMDPNHFIALILHKFKLDPGPPPELVEYHATILEEFFRLLISLCGERFIPGVSAATFHEQTRRHLIHILATEPKPHSKITKQLPDIITQKPAWEEILHQVADFKESTNINAAGKYELRSECFAEFCPFSYYYTTATEETKARNEIVRRKKAMQLSAVFIPPKLPPFTGLFAGVPFLLSSDFFVEEMSTFLQGLSRYLQTLTTNNHDTFPDRLIEKPLYLIAMAIIENEQQLEMDPHTTFDFVKKAVSGRRSSILLILKQLQAIEAIALHRETLRWLVAKIERLSNQLHGSSSSVDPETMSQQDEQTKENDNVQNARKRKAQERRDKLLKQMKTMQRSFLSQNPDLMADPVLKVPMEMSQESNMSQEEEKPVCTQLSWQLQATKTPEPTHTCILCQEETVSSIGSVVMLALVQRSKVLTRGPREPLEAADRAPLFVDLTYPNAVHASTCSHTMHYDCFEQFREPVLRSRRWGHLRRPYAREGYHFTDYEFLCPLCSRLSNTVIPVIPHMLVAKERGIVSDDGEDQSPSTSVDTGPPTMKAWLKAIEEILASAKHEKQEVVLKFPADVTDLHEETDRAEPEFVPPDQATEGGDSLDGSLGSPTDLLHCALDDFARMTQSVFEGDISEMHEPLAAWNATSTTIICAEMVARLDGLPILAKSPVRLSAALTGIIASTVALSAESAIWNYARDLLCSLTGEELRERSHKGLLNTNIFTTFVSSWFSSVILRKSIQMQDHPIIQENVEFERHLLFICTLAQIVQIFLFLDTGEFKDDGAIPAMDDPSLETSALYLACNQVRTYAGLPQIPSEATEKLIKVVNASLLPFIRCCALFFHHATGVPAPTRLESSDHQGALMSYLGLPQNLTEFFDVSGQLSLDPLIRKWCKDAKVIERATTLPSHLSYPAVSEVPALMSFPHDYSDLIGAAASFKCPKFASEDSICPTMCIVCGVILCSQSYCCQQSLAGNEKLQVGACTHHAHTCGAGGGMFLRVRESMIVLLHGVCPEEAFRGCFIHAPYLDRYGETDKGLRRGNPLYLSEARLLELRKLWLSHGVAERIFVDIESKHLHHVDWDHL